MSAFYRTKLRIKKAGDLNRSPFEFSLFSIDFNGNFAKLVGANAKFVLQNR